jgi:hypothetical protein
MFRSSLFLALLFSTLSANAGSSYSGDSISKIFLEMRYLKMVGEEIHQKYDLSEREQIKACTFEYGHNGTRARGLIGAVNRISYPDKEALIQAAWAAYSCSSCKGDGKICETIDQEIDNIKAFAESDVSPE